MSDRPGFINVFTGEPYHMDYEAVAAYQAWCHSNSCTHGHCYRDRAHRHNAGSPCEHDRFLYDANNKLVCGACAQHHIYSMIVPCGVVDCPDFDPAPPEEWQHQKARQALSELGIQVPSPRQIEIMIGRMHWTGPDGLEA